MERLTRRGGAEVMARWLTVVGAALLLAACRDQSTETTPTTFPVIDGAAVAANPNNVISAVVTARVRFADSVAVQYGPVPALDSITPAVVPAGEAAVIPVLGLLPGTSYLMRVVVYGEGAAVPGVPLGFVTDTLPGDLPRYTAGGSGPAPGLVAFAAGRYGLVIDNTGRVVWYRLYHDGPGLNFEAEPTGRYVARPTTPDPTDLDLWVEVDPLGNVTRTFGCGRGLEPRFHDLIEELDGGYWIMCDETRTMDLTAVGGVATAKVMGTVIQHVSTAGDVLFEWSPFDHFAITDLELAARTGASVNWTHGNAIDLDTDGNLIASFRSLSELTKIDTRTGEVLWRMGGLRDQFDFLGAPGPGFARQHGLRVTGPGQLILLDNQGDPAASRAERYVVDTVQHTATLVASYGSTPAVSVPLGGSTQALPGGHVLVSFGPTGRVQEYDSTGQVVWQIDGNAGYVFRAQRILSLYHPGVGSPR